MDGIQITLSFMMPDRRIVAARAFLDDPALLAATDPFARCQAGLQIEGEDDMLLILDDFDHIEAVLLDAAPAQLEAGSGVSYAYRYAPERLEIRVEGDLAVLDDLDGTEISAPVADVVAGLRAAQAELAALRARSD